jgi:hypothetical protein
MNRFCQLLIITSSISLSFGINASLDSAKAAQIFIERGCAKYIEPVTKNGSTTYIETEITTIGEVWGGGEVQVCSNVKNVKNVKAVKFKFECKDAKQGNPPKPKEGDIELKGTEGRFVEDVSFCPRERANPSQGEKNLSNDKKEYSSPLARDLREIPYIVSPRYTLVCNKFPYFSWASVESEQPGKTRYNVMLYEINRGFKKPAWLKPYSIQATDNYIEKMSYPTPEEGSLKERTTYKFVVTVECGSSSGCPSSEDEEHKSQFNLYRYPYRPRYQSPVVGLTFELVNEVIASKQLENCDKVKPHTLFNHFLYAETIEMIESQKIDTKSFYLYKILSDSYFKVGLDCMAVNSLKLGIEHAKKYTKNREQMKGLQQNLDSIISKTQPLCTESAEVLH